MVYTCLYLHLSCFAVLIYSTWDKASQALGKKEI